MGTFPRQVRSLRLAVLAVLLVFVAFASGWIAKGTASSAAPASHALRLGGYQFIDPLLLCNVNNPSSVQEDKTLATSIESLIQAHTKSGDISKASVYFADLTTGQWADVNPGEEYYPSSLGKIPIMVAYYQLNESSPGTLDKRIYYPVGGTDLNLMQDITPEEAIVPGNTYTVEQLIGYMIKYSDNNAAQLLYTNIDQDTLNSVYADLNIPVNEDPNLLNLDFITPHQISTLFRVLYNATYLSRDDSEAALKLMSEGSFTQGIVAGVASSTTVSHKLGLVGIAPNNVLTEHELHDCGIVYDKDPYLLCVMTRGSGSLSTLEGIIAQISSIAYKAVGQATQQD